LRMTMRDWMRKVSVMTRDRSEVLYILRKVWKGKPILLVWNIFTFPEMKRTKGRQGLNGRTGFVLWSRSTCKACV
jgi:hypothetical protein